MKEEDALKCLRSLVTGIKEALDELHLLGFSHNDIRLPNVCFDESYRAILIDIDRINDISEPFDMFESSSSCMYDCDGKFNISDGRIYVISAGVWRVALVKFQTFPISYGVLLPINTIPLSQTTYDVPRSLVASRLESNSAVANRAKDVAGGRTKPKISPRAPSTKISSNTETDDSPISIVLLSSEPTTLSRSTSD